MKLLKGGIIRTRTKTDVDFLHIPILLQSCSRTFAVGSVYTYKIAKVSMDGEIKMINLQTSEILKSVPSLFARDLFSLHLTSRQERFLQRGSRRARPPRRPPAVILPRRDSILLCFGNVRAVALRQQVLLFDAHNPIVQQFGKSLAQRFRERSSQATTDPDHNIHYETPGRHPLLPLELVFMEEALRDTVNAFNRRTRLFEPIVDNFLDKVSNEVFSDSGVHLLVPVKDSLQSFEMQVKQSLETLTDLLNNRDRMMLLLLTDQAHSQLIGIDMPDDHLEDVELLLDEYARQLNNTLMEISMLLQRVQSKQEFVTLALSSYRNRMIRMNVMIGIAGLSMGMGTFVSGYFGMNMLNGFEQTPGAFYNIVMGTSLAGMVVAVSSLNYLSGRTMQRRAAFRLGELETLSGALSDMCALDYTLKAALEEYGAKPMNKQEFALELKKARSSRIVSEREVDLLFDIFDIVKDGQIGSDDFAVPDQFHLPPKVKAPVEMPSIMDS